MGHLTIIHLRSTLACLFQLITILPRKMCGLYSSHLPELCQLIANDTSNIKFLCQAGVIGLEMFGFKVPITDIPHALKTVSLSTSLGICRSLALMLHSDPSKR